MADDVRREALLDELRTASLTSSPPALLAEYFRLCAEYHTDPDPSVVVALRYDVVYMQLNASLTAAGLVPLCEVLKRSRVVTSLDLRRCSIGSPGCYALKDLLLNNCTIRNINVSNNDIGEHGAVALAQGLEGNTSVERVYLRGNRIGQSGATAFARVIKSTVHLKLLDVSNNSLRSGGVTTLQDAVAERVRERARARARARRSGLFTGPGAIKVRDIDVPLEGNLVQEEVTNSILHGTGLVLSAFGAYPLLRVAQEANDPAHSWGVIIYICALLAMYASTTLGHSFFMFSRTSHVFRIIDHSAVYLLIAGTYTPFLLVNLRNRFAGRVFFIFVWVCALLGVCLSAFARRLRPYRVYLYVIIGWCSIVAYRSILACVHPNGVMLLAAGGVLFTVAFVLYVRAGPAKPNHGTYVLGLLGCLLHYLAVYNYVGLSTCTDTTFLPEALLSLFESGMAWHGS